MLWLRNLFLRRRVRDELAEEIRQHIAEHTEELLAQGRSPVEASHEARRNFGNATLIHERSVETWQWRWLENLWADLRFALHQFRKSPGYTLTAILTLAIGIGANAAIFTLVDDVLLRSLPVSYPEQLIEIGFRNRASGEFIHGQSLALIDALHGHTASLEAISAWDVGMVSLPDSQGTLRSIRASLVTGNGLSLLGVQPYLGRLLMPSDDVIGGPEGGWPVVLDYGFWRANYRGAATVIGRHITVSSHPAVIVGVLPRGFDGLQTGLPSQVYMPSHFVSEISSSWSGDDPYAHPEQISQFAVGRLRIGSSLAGLNAELAAASPALMQATLSPQALAGPRLQNTFIAAQSASRGIPFLEREYRQPLLLLQAIVSLILLLCCVNLGGLQVARVQARQHEFAVRSALGAGRIRILQQCLTESLLLALIGSLLAAWLAWTSTTVLSTFLTPAGAVRNTSLHPNAHVLVFTTALAFLVTLLFGLAPAVLAGHIASFSLLKTQAAHRRTGTLRRRIFVPLQFALALVLVFGAGLFTQTLLRLRSSQLGFQPSRIMEITAQFQSLRKTPAEIAALYRSMVASLRDAPGVQAATTAAITPLKNYAPGAIVRVVGSQQNQPLDYNVVGDEYFSTLGTRLLAGREFTAGDSDSSICILSQTAAHLLFPTGSPIGEMLKVRDEREPVNAACRIIGVAEDARYTSLRDPAPPTLYLPMNVSSFHGGYSNNKYFLIRAHTDAEAIAAYRAALARYAPDTGVMTFLPLRDQVDQSLGSERLIAMLTTAFAGIALLLSAIGIFGLLALRVQERTRELGVRIAVGATRMHLLRMVLGDALRMVLLGSACGLALAAIGYQFIRRFLYGVSSADIGTALASLAVLIAVAMIAAAIPARRAALLDPIQALRTE